MVGTRRCCLPFLHGTGLPVGILPGTFSGARCGPSSWGEECLSLAWSAARSVRVSVHDLPGVSALRHRLRWCHWAPRRSSTEAEKGVAKSTLYGPSHRSSRFFRWCFFTQIHSPGVTDVGEGSSGSDGFWSVIWEYNRSLFYSLLLLSQESNLFFHQL